MTPKEEAEFIASHAIAGPRLDLSAEEQQGLVGAYRLAARDFYRAGGVLTLRDWCLMPQVVRDGFLSAAAELDGWPGRDAFQGVTKVREALDEAVGKLGQGKVG